MEIHELYLKYIKYKDRRGINVSIATDQKSAPISIQDIVVAAKAKSGNPTGEFGNPTLSGGRMPPHNESQQQVIDRLFTYASSLITDAAEQHKANNFANGKIIPGKENNITRLVTNEFFFYTKQPLSILEFQALQQKLYDLAKTQPENLHLILGSFAVRVGDKVMNVVAQVECGPEPQLNLIVKNYPSSIDPIYHARKPNGSVVPLLNVDIGRGDNISAFKINVGGKDRQFSFNNVLRSKTAGGAQFISCVDICLDHAHGAARKRLNQELDIAIQSPSTSREPLPTLCSHVVVSNWINLEKDHCLGPVTHADPVRSYKSCKQGANVEKSSYIPNPSFGTPCTTFTTQPTLCSPLPPTELAKVHAANYARQQQIQIQMKKDETEKLLQRHYQEQSHSGYWGLTGTQGYPPFNPSTGANFHPSQAKSSRFTNNIGRLTSEQVMQMQSNPDAFFQRYYNSSSLGAVRAFEGPSPLGNQSEHVMRFINSLYENNIGAHVGAGNPLSGMIANNNGTLSITSRGFFDITSIPHLYLDPNYIWSKDDVLIAKSNYMAKLWNNPEIVKLRKQGYDGNTLAPLLQQLTDNFFNTLDQMKQNNLHIESKLVSDTTGVERYEIEMNWNGYQHKIDYLSLSRWDDFAGNSFSRDQIHQLCLFYQNNSDKALGVNCTAGLGRSGVIALAFELQKNYEAYFDPTTGYPNIQKIDECLNAMRTERPGLIQTAEQYSLAITLANQMAYSFYLSSVPDDQYLSHLQNTTEHAITTHQAKIEADRLLTRPLPQTPREEAPIQTQPRPSAPVSTPPIAPKVETKQPSTSTSTHASTLTKDETDILKKSKLSINDYDKYAAAIKKLFTKDKNLTLDLLSKLSVNDRRNVLFAIDKSNPDKKDDLCTKILLASRDRASNLIHSIVTRRSSLEERIQQVEISSPSKTRH